MASNIQEEPSKPDLALQRVIKDVGYPKVSSQDVLRQATGVSKYAIARCQLVSVECQADESLGYPVFDKEIGLLSGTLKSFQEALVKATIQAPIVKQKSSSSKKAATTTVSAASVASAGDASARAYSRFNTLIATEDIAKGHIITLCKPSYIASASSMLGVGEAEKFESYRVSVGPQPPVSGDAARAPPDLITDRDQFILEAMAVRGSDYTGSELPLFSIGVLGVVNNGWVHFHPDRPRFASEPVSKRMSGEDATYLGYLANAGVASFPCQVLMDHMMRIVYNPSTKKSTGAVWSERDVDRFVLTYLCLTADSNATRSVTHLAVTAIVATRDIKTKEAISAHEAADTALWRFMLGQGMPTDAVIRQMAVFHNRLCTPNYVSTFVARMAEEAGINVAPAPPVTSSAPEIHESASAVVASGDDDDEADG